MTQTEEHKLIELIQQNQDLQLLLANNASSEEIVHFLKLHGIHLTSSEVAKYLALRRNLTEPLSEDELAKVAGGTTLYVYYGSCGCGWIGTTYIKRSDADEEAIRHNGSNTGHSAYVVTK